MKAAKLGGLFHIVVAVLTIAAAPAVQAWPDKPVRLIVPGPPGGTVDMVARVLAEQLSAQSSQPVVVENRPGASGAMALQAMLSASADGQTLMVASSNLLTEVPLMMKTVADLAQDVQPLISVARGGIVLVAAPSVPASDLSGVIAYAMGNPGKLSFASYSIGTSSHFAGMIFNQKAGLDLQHVPFPGSPPALQHVMSGEIALMFDSIATSLPLIKAGRVKAIAMAAKRRSAYLPDVPTMAELGYPEIDFSNWLGVMVAAKVPATTAEAIGAAMAKAAGAPTVVRRLQGLGLEPETGVTAEQLGRSVKADRERNAGIVKAFDISAGQ